MSAFWFLYYSSASSLIQRLALARSHHSLTVIDNKAYVFGGEQPNGQLCSSDVHVVSLPLDTTTEVDYACYPAIPLQEAGSGETYIPKPRRRHAAYARGRFLVIHGGCDDTGTPIADSCLWLWDTHSLKWNKVDAVTQLGKTLTPRFDHHIFIDETQDILVLHGGRTNSGQEQSSETWLYAFDTLAWTELPAAAAPPTAAALVNNVLYTISRASDMSGSIHFLNLGPNATEREKPNALAWQTVEFPVNPLTPGPQPREGAGLVPVSTGVGRYYLVYFFGAQHGSDSTSRPMFSDVWSLQLPSSALTLAGLKDKIRERIPHAESGALSWAEVDILPVEQLDHEGKAHPGPRSYFGAAAAGGKTVVLWGGVSAKGKEGDGWMLQVQ